MLSMLKRLWRNQSGQDLTEYGLLMVLVGLLLAVGIQAVGKSIAKSTAASANTLKAVAAGPQGGGGGEQGDSGDQQGDNDQQGGGHH